MKKNAKHANPITRLHTSTCNWLLEQHKDAFTLYAFYCLTSARQKEVSVWANASYVMRGLRWGRTRYLRARKILLEGEIINDRRSRLSNGTVAKCYVWVRPVIDQTTSIENRMVVSPTGGSERINASKESISATIEMEASPQKDIREHKTGFRPKEIYKYTTLESITKEVLVEVAAEKKVHIDDCKNAFGRVTQKVLGGKQGGWRDLVQMLKQEIDYGLEDGRYEEYLSLEEQLMKEYGPPVYG